MLKKPLQSNNGNALIIVLVIVGILAVSGIGYFVYVIQRNGKIVKQYNAYAEKRTEFYQIRTKLLETTAKEKSGDNLIPIQRELLSKWKEVEKQEIPSFVEAEIKECHKLLKEFAENSNKAADLFEITQKRNLTRSELDELSSLGEKTISKAAISKVDKECTDAEERYTEELNKLGIKKIESEDK